MTPSPRTTGTTPSLRLAADPAAPAGAATTPLLLQLELPAAVLAQIAATQDAARQAVAETARLASEVAELRRALEAAAGPGEAPIESAAPAKRRWRLPAGYISRAMFADLLSVSLVTFDRMSSAGKIGPAPIRPNGDRGRALYRQAEVNEWLAWPRDGHGALPGRREWTARQAARKR